MVQPEERYHKVKGVQQERGAWGGAERGNERGRPKVGREKGVVVEGRKEAKGLSAELQKDKQ